MTLVNDLLSSAKQLEMGAVKKYAQEVRLESKEQVDGLYTRHISQSLIDIILPVVEFVDSAEREEEENSRQGEGEEFSFKSDAAGGEASIDESRTADGKLWWYKCGKAQVVVRYSSENGAGSDTIREITIDVNESCMQLRRRWDGNYYVVFKGAPSDVGFSDVRLCQETKTLSFFKHSREVGHLGRDGRIHGNVKPFTLTTRESIIFTQKRMMRAS